MSKTERESLELPVFRNLDIRKAQLGDEIRQLEAELANDVAKEKPRAARK